MNPYKEKEFIQAAMTQTGWIYDVLPWFSKEEACQAELKRQDLIRRLSNELQYSFNGTKPHLGNLSPGCRHCGTPASIFHFINRQCNRTCFFCPENRSKNPELKPWTDGLWFDDDDVFINFLKTFSIKSIGFTGGEPLIAMGKLPIRLNQIRQRCDRNIHIRLYTNGDLLNHEILGQLHEVGLDEIRINISAREYDLSPVRLARNSKIPVVTVEIPAIPEHIETVKKAILEMDSLGVDYLNLIQLEVTGNNYQALDLKNYHVIPRPTLLPVLESEICTLELMLFRLEKHLRLPVSYCGFPYRFEITNAQRSLRYNSYDMKGWEEVTEAGFIRTLVITECEDQFKRTLGHLENESGNSGFWFYDSSNSEIFFHRKLLTTVLSTGKRFKIRYHEKRLSAFSLASFEWERNLLAEFELSLPAIHCWHQIYLEHRDQNEAFRDFVHRYSFGTESAAVMLSREKQLLRQIGIWELLEVKFPEPLF